jgi:hypothetical protein
MTENERVPFITSALEQALTKLEPPEKSDRVRAVVDRKRAAAAAHERPIIPPGVHMPTGAGRYGAPAERRIAYAPPPPK